MGFAAEHRLSEASVNTGVQIFKMAAMQNFIQGRRMNAVAAACLYAACRTERPCRVMLIDFADSCQINVFKLGRCFKSLYEKVSLGVMQPILPEDLIYKFATKLEFGPELDRVAETAVRLVNRMSRDWMVMGRRPSGICGACLILAARIHNFRRTTTEVVYVVKVTTQTLQKRLDEFQYTASSEMTVEGFLASDLLESAHDPPSFYQQSEEFKAKKKTRKRKRLGDDEDADGEARAQSRVASETPSAQADPARSSAPNAYDGPLPSVEYSRTDHVEQNGDNERRDSLLMPPPSSLRTSGRNTTAKESSQPDQNDEVETDGEVPIDPALLAAAEPDAPEVLGQLVAEHGDKTLDPTSSASNTTTTEGAVLKRGRGRPRKVPIVNAADKQWVDDERELENQISEMINDPNTVEHTRAFASAEQRARAHLLVASASTPVKEIPMSVEIDEDEFADDPEVQNCLLTEIEARKKETLWVNENKDWLREQQQKEYAKKMAVFAGPKNKRNRTKQRRMGEGQESPAASPYEATMGVIAARNLPSKKINYNAIQEMFRPGGLGMIGSAATSRVTSRANSVAPSSVARSVASSVAGSVAGGDDDMLGDIGDDDEPYIDEPVGADPDDNWRNDFEDNDDDEGGEGDEDGFEEA